MKQGKKVCETLKAIRSEIAAANEIDYKPIECHHEGDCAGTCPACESEVRWLESMLRKRQALGKAVTIAGMSVAMGAAVASCNLVQPNGYLENPNDSVIGDTVVTDSHNIDASQTGKYIINPPEEKPSEGEKDNIDNNQ
ncbi:MAG: hypothetical protein J6Y87_06685 [Muribaculaceae bacterium]|nr:hypothetical protein [Muribaculaceae bacterium]MBP5315534.1 hypothetical protein [Muribaculaceae bacterium]